MIGYKKGWWESILFLDFDGAAPVDLRTMGHNSGVAGGWWGRGLGQAAEVLGFRAGWPPSDLAVSLA